jgi:hypothetical protein
VAHASLGPLDAVGTAANVDALAHHIALLAPGRGLLPSPVNDTTSAGGLCDSCPRGVADNTNYLADALAFNSHMRASGPRRLIRAPYEWHVIQDLRVV